MVQLIDRDMGVPIGVITPEEHAILVAALEKEGPHDHDYWVDAISLEAIEREHPEAGALVALLRTAIGGREGVEVLCGSDW